MKNRSFRNRNCRRWKRRWEGGVRCWIWGVEL